MRWGPVALLSVPLLAACGTTGNDTGHWEGTPADAGSLDAYLDFDGAYPTADPDPDAGPAGNPSFDGGAADAGGAVTCSGKTQGSGGRTLVITSGGIPRTTILHVPSGYDPSAGTMLVLNFHGFTNNALEQEVISRMDQSSDTHGYIVGYPEGVATSWNAGDCCGTAWVNAVDDVQFVKDLLAKLESDYCIDPSRVYATGYSNGGFLSYRLACEMADTFAAVAPVAGQLGIPLDQCKPSRPVPVLEFHGTSDPIVPYNGGTPIIPVNIGPVLAFPSVTDSLQFWIDHNGCLSGPTKIYEKGDATCTAWGTCKGQGDVVHCKIDQGGHTWPGGVPVPLVGKTSTDISATETMYQFFVAHPMP